MKTCYKQCKMMFWYYIRTKYFWKHFVETLLINLSIFKKQQTVLYSRRRSLSKIFLSKWKLWKGNNKISNYFLSGILGVILQHQLFYNTLTITSLYRLSTPLSKCMLSCISYHRSLNHLKNDYKKVHKYFITDTIKSIPCDRSKKKQKLS